MNFGSQCSWWVWLAFGHASSLRLGSQWESVSVNVGTQSPETNSYVCHRVSQFLFEIVFTVLYCDVRGALQVLFSPFLLIMNKFR